MRQKIVGTYDLEMDLASGKLKRIEQ